MKLLKYLILFLIRVYQLSLAPMFGSLGFGCRFQPTCSHYAVEAIQRHGTFRGSLLAGKRILRCNPWCDGGFDPVDPEQVIYKGAQGTRGCSNG